MPKVAFEISEEKKRHLQLACFVEGVTMTAFLRRLLDEALEAYPTREEFGESWRRFKEGREDGNDSN